MSKNSVADDANDLMPQNTARELSKRPIKKRSGVFKWSKMQVWEPEVRAFMATCLTMLYSPNFTMIRRSLWLAMIFHGLSES